MQMCRGMHQHQIGFNLPLHDPAAGQPVTVRWFGTVAYQGGGGPQFDNPSLVNAVQTAIGQVIAPRLAQNQLALPTLGMSLGALSGELMQHANHALSASGIGLTQLQLQAQVPESATAPAAAQIAAAPGVMESVAGNFAGNVADQVASSIPRKVNVRVGGFKVGVGAGGIDEEGLVGQLKSKIFDHLLEAAIIGGVLVLLFCITSAVILKIILSL